MTIKIGDIHSLMELTQKGLFIPGNTDVYVKIIRLILDNYDDLFAAYPYLNKDEIKNVFKLEREWALKIYGNYREFIEGRDIREMTIDELTEIAFKNNRKVDIEFIDKQEK